VKKKASEEKKVSNLVKIKKAIIKSNPNDDKGSLPDVNYNRGYVYP